MKNHEGSVNQVALYLSWWCNCHTGELRVELKCSSIKQFVKWCFSSYTAAKVVAREERVKCKTCWYLWWCCLDFDYLKTLSKKHWVRNNCLKTKPWFHTIYFFTQAIQTATDSRCPRVWVILTEPERSWKSPNNMSHIHHIFSQAIKTPTNYSPGLILVEIVPVTEFGTGDSHAGYWIYFSKLTSLCKLYCRESGRHVLCLTEKLL